MQNNSENIQKQRLKFYLVFPPKLLTLALQGGPLKEGTYAKMSLGSCGLNAHKQVFLPIRAS